MGFSGQYRPFLAIMEADLSSLLKSKLTYGWLVAGLFLEVIRVLGSRAGGETSGVVGPGLSDFLLIWSLIIIGIAASAVSSEAGEFADSIMSKSVTRFDYLFAKFTSRILYVLLVFGVIALVLVGLSLELVKNDYETSGLAYTILFVVLALVMLTTLGVALSTFAPSSIISIVGLLVVWYFMTFFFPILGLGILSPANVSSELARNIQGIWGKNEWETAVAYGAIALTALALSTVYFYYKDV